VDWGRALGRDSASQVRWVVERLAQAAVSLSPEQRAAVACCPAEARAVAEAAVQEGWIVEVQWVFARVDCPVQAVELEAEDCRAKASAAEAECPVPMPCGCM
jgi:hypothetical protein